MNEIKPFVHQSRLNQENNLKHSEDISILQKITLSEMSLQDVYLWKVFFRKYFCMLN